MMDGNVFGPTAGDMSLDGLKVAFPYCEVSDIPGYPCLRVTNARYAGFCKELKAYGFNYLSGLTAVDWPKGRPGASEGSAKPCMELVGHAFNIPGQAQVQFVVELPRLEPTVASVVAVWPTADWHEREVFDMYGITFLGHPNPVRILTPDGFTGHPLLKDYVRGGSTS